MTQGSLSYQFKTADIITKVMVINGLIFLAITIFSALLQLNPESLIRWFQLPEEIGQFLVQPWSLLTYCFIHTGFFHVLFNMLWLYFFGRHVLNLFSEARFLTVYLLGAICGGVLYMISYNIFPAFSAYQGNLIGASAAIMAIMAFIATYIPNTPIRILTIQLKLWHIAVFLIVLDLIRLPALHNAGGLLAHLGGAIFGYVYARQLMKGNDIGRWFEKLMNSVTSLFKPEKKQPFKKVHRTTQSNVRRSNIKEDRSDHQKMVDTLLDKIGKSGYESLTKEEKDFLFKAGKDS